MKMNEHALKLLDFFRIRSDVESCCLSPEGQKLIEETYPLANEEELFSLKEKVRAIYNFFFLGKDLPSGVFTPIEEALKILQIQGAVLSIEELWSLGMWTSAYEKLKKWFKNIDNEEIASLINNAIDLSQVPVLVFRIVSPEGEIKELPELQAIMSRIRRINSDIQKASDSFFQDESIRAHLQNDLPTQRDGRTVLAVKTGSKNRIKGIIHEVSASGQTVYIEPEVLVRKNNELVEEEANYNRELQKILRDVSSKLFLRFNEICEARDCVANLDSLYARARYSFGIKGTFAEKNSTSVVLSKARHPILGSRAVPIDILMPEGTRTLIITGPNTGGKTVSLKTIGLLSMMNQFGLAIPANEGSSIPCFDNVWADIGDEQSIDQSLSTFSAHMKNISKIIDGATNRSLVLLDELGSGTDPEEGCAIAMSILDYFIEKGTLSILTTHHGILKNFGYTKEGVLNASVDFDSATCSPTYRILMGVPGESRALEVALKNGISKKVIEDAKNYLKDERTDVSSLLRGLSEKHQELDSIKNEEKKRLREAIEEQRKAELKTLKLRQEESVLRQNGIVELKNLLKESRKTLENLVRELREGEVTKEQTTKVKEFLSKLENEVNKAEENAIERQDELKKVNGINQNIEVGSSVVVLPGRKRGKVIRNAKKGKWIVETDSLRLTVDESDLEVVPELKEMKPVISVEKVTGSRVRAKFELDIRGYRYTEAVETISRQLDDAILDGLNNFSIIHGTGEGVLQNAVKETLKKDKRVKAFCYANPEEGGHGKTIVQL